MNDNCSELRPRRRRLAGVWLAHAAVVALVVALVIPARAADERAIKSRVAPTYPEVAKRMRISGAVRLTVTVDPAGRVIDVKPLSGNNMLSVAAEEAVRKWRFEPGSSVSNVEVSLNFTLN